MKIFQSPLFALALRLSIGLFANGCHLHRLEVQTQYLTHEYLASYHVDSPDPRLYESVLGQQLLIQWSLSAAEIEDTALFLYLKVRLRNHQEQEVKVPITSKRGTYLYTLANEAYCQSQGILTYFAEIRTTSCTLASWKHPLWAELITFDLSDLKTETAKKD